MTPSRKAFILTALLYLLVLFAAWPFLSEQKVAAPSLKPVPVTLNMFASATPASQQKTPVTAKKEPQKEIQQANKPKSKPQPKHEPKPQTKAQTKSLPNNPKPHAVTKKTQPQQKPKPTPVKKATQPTPPKAAKTITKVSPQATPALKVTKATPNNKPAKPAQPSPSTPAPQKMTTAAQPASAYKAIEQRYLQALSQQIAYYAQQNYPYRARRRHQQGKVILRFTLHPDGHITQIQIHASSGHPFLDQAALEVVQQQMKSQFKPFPKEMPTKAKKIVVPIQYSLQWCSLNQSERTTMKHTPPIKNIEEVQQDLVKRFTHFNNWKDRYKYLIDMGKTLQKMDESLKNEENRIHGCQSQVWIHIEEGEDERLYMQATSDAAIVAGLIAMLLRIYNGRTPEEIANAPLDFLAEIGLLQHLSPNRSTGLYHMIKRIQGEAQKRLKK